MAGIEQLCTQPGQEKLLDAPAVSTGLWPTSPNGCRAVSTRCCACRDVPFCVATLLFCKVSVSCAATTRLSESKCQQQARIAGRERKETKLRQLLVARAPEQPQLLSASRHVYTLDERWHKRIHDESSIRISVMLHCRSPLLAYLLPGCWPRLLWRWVERSHCCRRLQEHGRMGLQGDCCCCFGRRWLAGC